MDHQLLQIMAIGFALALFFGFITQKLGLSSIVGYLLAGFLIGPATPGFVADYSLAFQLSEAGVILLMFGVGLHFNTKDLMAVKGVAIPGAIVQSTAATICGMLTGKLLGLEFMPSLILGFGLAVASTVMLLRVLEDNNMVSTVHGHVAVGWLVVEDIFTVLILVILPSLASIMAVGGFSSPEGSLEIVKAIAIAGLRIALLWILIMEVGGRFVPWALSKVAKTRSQELFTLTVLVMAFATAVLAATLFQASLALGAFLGGMVVGKSRLSHQAGADLLPLRDAFSVLFFIAVGMLFDPRFLLDYPLLIIAALIIVLVVKPITALGVVTVLGYSPKTALTVAAGLSQVGEFSFILAQEAKRLELAGDVIYNTIVVCAIISITLNPSAFRKIPKMENFLKSKKKLWKMLNYIAEQKGKHSNKSRELAKNLLPKAEYLAEIFAIVVGYGPTGRKIIKTLKEQGIKCVVIDMNIDTINSLSEEGQSAVFGDSSKK